MMRTNIHAEHLRQVQARLDAMQLAQSKAEAELQRRIEERQKSLFANIDSVIEQEEHKLQQKLEEERRVKEEEERKTKEAEEKRKKAEELAQKAEDEKKLKEEAAKQEKEKVEREELEEQQRSEQEAKEKDARRAAGGMSTPEEDFNSARDHLIVRIFPPLQSLANLLAVPENRIHPTSQSRQTDEIGVGRYPSEDNSKDWSTHQRPSRNRQNIQ